MVSKCDTYFHAISLSRLDDQIKKYEKKLHIKPPWQASDDKFKQNLSSLQKKEKRALLLKLYDSAVEYEFVKTLKGKKYAGKLLISIVKIN